MTKDRFFALSDVLRYHARKYPIMSPADAVKLIYQNEFGGGHIISDEKKCLEYLISEYRRVPQTSGRVTEDIGGGIVRVELSALDSHGITTEELCNVFIRSAEMVKGSKASFEQKLDLLRSLTAEGIFGFTAESLSEYLSAYAEAGYPPVSHSEEYRKAYSPAYRIVLAELLKLYFREE